MGRRAVGIRLSRASPEKIVAGAAVVAVAAWIAAARTMGGMDSGPGTPLGPFGGFVVSWIVMLTAMMLPAELRFTLAYARAAHAETPPGGISHVAAFLVGYLLIWTAYGAGAWVLDGTLRRAAPAALAWTARGPQAAGLLVAIAGLFQFSRWKRACLTHCISPFGFFTRHWYAGRTGAVRLGALHGLYCLGCCWALMAMMFAVGIMSLYWMSLLGLVMFSEKIAPGGLRIAPLFGILLLALGIWIAVDPASAPGLTIPSRASHAH